MDAYLIAMDLDNLTGINHAMRIIKQKEEKEFLTHVRESSSNPHRILITRYTTEGATTAPLEEA